MCVRACFLWLRRDNSDVATGVNGGVASSSRWSNSICYPETAIPRIRGLLKTTVWIRTCVPQEACSYMVG